MFFKPYMHLLGYLHRYTIFCIGKLKVRIHHILSEDKTHWFHDHPFHYVSIILSGGYVESIMTPSGIQLRCHTVGSIIIRTCKTPHRIEHVLPNTKTLFFAYYNSHVWQLYGKNDNKYEDGVYWLGDRYSKCVGGKWHKSSKILYNAQNETRLSIHQVHDHIIFIEDSHVTNNS